MRLRDAKVGQKVKIKLAKNQTDVDKKFNGRIGIVQYSFTMIMIQVYVTNLGYEWFYPRELQLKKGRKK